MSKQSYPDVVSLTQALIRIDTSNWGDGKANPEVEAVNLIQPLLEEAGLICNRYEASPGRTNLIARWRGAQPRGNGLLLHSHLDVVPANSEDWTHKPFDGDIAEGMLWGRGAIDMKNMAAMIVCAVINLSKNGFRPKEDLVLAFFADEEDGTTLGSSWMEQNHPEAFEGVTTAVGEGGGYSIEIGSSRAYLMNTGEKGVRWIEMKARGQAGHGALPAVDNPIPKLSAAITAVSKIKWPQTITKTTELLFSKLSALSGIEPIPENYEKLIALAGPSAPRFKAALSEVSNVTMVTGGYKANVVPENATAMIDVRFVPGREDAVLREIQAVVGPDIELTTKIELDAFETPFEGDVIRNLEDIVREQDPGAIILPHVIPGGTDAKPLRRLGIQTIGFIPLLLPVGFEFPRMFHGVDERVPIEGLKFGEEVIRKLIAKY